MFLNRLFASFDDSHAGDGIVQTGKGGAPVANDFLKKILPHGTNGVGVRGVSLGVNHGRSVFDPVPVAIAGGSFGADHFDHKGPRVSRMVVGCETGAQVGKGVVVHFHGHHGKVLLWDGTVVDGGFHAGNELGLSNQIEGTVGMMGEDLANDSGIAGGNLFGMVDVVEDVDGNEISQFSAFNQFLRPHHRGLVNVVVHGSDLDPLLVGEGLDLFDFLNGHCGRFFDQDVFARFDGLHAIGMMRFHVGENVDHVDCLNQILRGVKDPGVKERSLFLGFGTRAIPNAIQFGIGRGLDALSVQIGDVARSMNPTFSFLSIIR